MARPADIKNAKRRKKSQISTIADLHPDPRNARRHTPQNVGAIVSALNTVGAARSIVIDEDGTILAGNATVRAAGEAGIQKVQVVESDGKTLVAVRRSGLTAKEKASLAILDNRAGELAEWDEPQLASLVADFDLNVSDLAFEQAEFDTLIGKEPPAIVEDELPSNVPQRCACGDLWQLGEHRLLCGDSTKAEDVGRLMAGAKADLCITDPPYGADIHYATHTDTQDALIGLIAGFFPLAEQYADVIALTSGINNIWQYKRADWVLCWFYAAGTGRTPWGFSAWQPVLVWGKDPKLANGEGAHPDGFNWPMTANDAEERKTIEHACPKPVTSWAKWIARLSNEKTKTLYDPFLGSGTTIIAAEQLNRRCFGIEISPKYCDVIIARWEKFTGKSAEKVDV